MCIQLSSFWVKSFKAAIHFPTRTALDSFHFLIYCISLSLTSKYFLLLINFYWNIVALYFFTLFFNWRKFSLQSVNIINGNEEIIRDTTAIKRIMRDCCGQFNKKDQKLSEKQAKHLNRYFSKKDLRRATKHMKKYSTSFVISQM